MTQGESAQWDGVGGGGVGGWDGVGGGMGGGWGGRGGRRSWTTT